MLSSRRFTMQSTLVRFLRPVLLTSVLGGCAPPAAEPPPKNPEPSEASEDGAGSGGSSAEDTATGGSAETAASVVEPIKKQDKPFPSKPKALELGGVTFAEAQKEKDAYVFPLEKPEKGLRFAKALSGAARIEVDVTFTGSLGDVYVGGFRVHWSRNDGPDLTGFFDDAGDFRPSPGSYASGDRVTFVIEIDAEKSAASVYPFGAAVGSEPLFVLKTKEKNVAKELGKDVAIRGRGFLLHSVYVSAR